MGQHPPSINRKKRTNNTHIKRKMKQFIVDIGLMKNTDMTSESLYKILEAGIKEKRLGDIITEIKVYPVK